MHIRAEKIVTSECRLVPIHVPLYEFTNETFQVGQVYFQRASMKQHVLYEFTLLSIESACGNPSTLKISSGHNRVRFRKSRFAVIGSPRNRAPKRHGLLHVS